MKNICIIPARGGSKRIPRKNIKEFAGQPMISYSIKAARASKLFEKVIVSTDDEEIARIAKEFGAEVPFMRPESLSDDFATTAEVTSHAIKWLNDVSQAVSAVCCIYATAPFIQESDLLAAEQLFKSGDWDFVFAATTFAFPIFRSFKKLDDGGVEMFYPEHFQTRSQDLPDAFHDAGQFYWGKPKAWSTRKPIFSRDSAIVELPRWRVQDIDTVEDWERAEKLYETFRKTLNG